VNKNILIILYVKYPIEYILVKVDKFIFLIDFIVVNIEKAQKKKSTLILDKLFMKTVRAIIDVDNKKLNVGAKDEKINFNRSYVFEVMQYLNNKG